MKKSLTLVLAASTLLLAACTTPHSSTSSSTTKPSSSTPSSIASEPTSSSEDLTRFDERLLGQWYGAISGGTNMKSYLITIREDAFVIAGFDDSTLTQTLPYIASDTGIAFYGLAGDLNNSVRVSYKGEQNMNGKTFASIALYGKVSLPAKPQNKEVSFSSEGTLYQSYVALQDFSVKPENPVVKAYQEVTLETISSPTNAYVDYRYEIISGSDYLMQKIAEEDNEQYFVPGVFVGKLADDLKVHTAEVKITEKRSGIEKTVSITVEPIEVKKVESISLSYSSTALVVGGFSTKPTITASPSDATDLSNLLKRVTYASDNEAVASVTNDGVVSGVSEGQATITATLTNKDGSTVTSSVQFQVKAANIDTSTIDGTWTGTTSMNGYPFTLTIQNGKGTLLRDSGDEEEPTYNFSFASKEGEVYQGSITIEEEKWNLKLDASDDSSVTFSIGEEGDYPFADSDSIVDVQITRNE